jgi:ferrous-iron efflux pump FieF
VGLKGWAAWSTGSTAMLGSLADTGLDLVASIATLAGVWVAGMPADDNHRFGHGKAEALSAMFQVMLIAASSVALAVHSVQQLASGERTGAAGDGILVSAIAIVGTLALLGWQQYVIRQTRSVAISTDHLHYKSDLLLNMAVIVALLLDQYAGGRGPTRCSALALRCGWHGAHGTHRKKPSSN